MSCIVFVAPLPPPVHGFSAINRAMLDRLRQRARVEAFDVAPARLALPALTGALLRVARLMFRARSGALYIALSGGMRQLVDLCFVAIARLAGARIFVHHHSFAYINHRPWYTRLLLRVAGGARHVVLCEFMGQMLAKAYSLDAGAFRVISNAAFLDLPEPPAPSRDGPMLRIGYLSAVSAEKGAYAFLETIAAAARRGIAVEGFIAGPVPPSEQARFEAALAQVPQARHLGAVYGEDKERFLASLDALLFPTTYVNEAEPVTIWEALGHGVTVIANARGCISGMVPQHAGWIVDEPGDFVDRAIDAIAELADDRDLRLGRHQAARAHFDEVARANAAQLEALLDDIAAGGSHAASL